MSRKHANVKRPNALRFSVTVNHKNFIDGNTEKAQPEMAPRDWYRGYLQCYAQELAENPEKYADVLDDARDFLCELRGMVGFQHAA